MIPATVVASPAPPVVHAPREYMVVVYGLSVVVAAFVLILIALLVVVVNSNGVGTDKGLADPAGLLGMVAIAIVGVGGAIVGFALGMQFVINANKERAAAEAAKDAVQQRAERYLAYLEPDIAKTLVK